MNQKPVAVRAGQPTVIGDRLPDLGREELSVVSKLPQPPLITLPVATP
ncbi:MAG: hypothetical protein ACR2PI_19315 [Hyphomicrobiaceae bacterium]